MPLFDKKVSISGKLFSVCDTETYNSNREFLKEDDQIAVEVTNGSESVILPIRSADSKDMVRPGIYPKGSVDFFSYPTTEEEQKEYKPSKDNVFSFNDIKNMQELIDKREKFENVTNQILETPDNITKPPFKEDDTPTMRALKEAIISKNIDIDKYKERFGDNFPNDKRKINDTDITLFILQRFCECLDLEMDITLKDAKGNIPNPMHEIITANVVPGNENCISIIKE